MSEWMLVEDEETLSPALSVVPGSLIAMSPSENTPPVDPEEVRRAAAGDREAFTRLFYQTYRYVYAIASSVLSIDEDIRDAIQDTYVRVFAGLPRLRAPEAFLSWLRTIARHCAVALQQRNGAAVPYTLEDAVDEAFLETEEGQQETALDVRRVLQELPEEQARLLVLVYYDGMRLAEIAKMWKKPASTVRSRFRRAKQALIAALKEHGIDRAMYSRGGLITTMVTALRDAIGTDILSATVAQEILDAVLRQASKTPMSHVAAKLARRRRDAAVLRIAAMVVALSLAVSVCTAVALRNRSSLPVATEGQTTTATIADTTALTTTTVFATTTAPTADDTTTASLMSTDVQAVQATDVGADSTTKAPPQSATVREADTVPVTTAGFVSDYRVGYANTVGNDPNNLLGDGRMAKQDNWLYFAAGTAANMLFKVNEQTGKKTLLYQGGGELRSLNVVGDWIYFIESGIRRIRTDGSDLQVLSLQEPQWIAVCGDQIYYTTASRYLYRMAADSWQSTQVYEWSVYMAMLTADELLVLSGNTLYSIDLQSGQQSSLSYEAIDHNMKALAMGDGRIFFKDSNSNLYSLDCKTGKWTDLSLQWTNAVYVAVDGGILHNHYRIYSLHEQTVTYHFLQNVFMNDDGRYLYVFGEKLYWFGKGYVCVYCADANADAGSLQIV